MVAKKIDNTLGVGATVRLVEPGRIPRGEGKAVRVVDKRHTE
jgi:phenylacetate-CoA ligase